MEVKEMGTTASCSFEQYNDGMTREVAGVSQITKGKQEIASPSKQNLRSPLIKALIKHFEKWNPEILK